jgi:two-component system torCAD operon response regulator TorR
MNEQTRKRHILLVDDDAVILALLSQVFRQEGFEVTEAPDARALRAALAREAPDLIILDINLPDESGFVLAQEIRTRSETGIIMLTSRNEEVDRLVGLELGADDYVTKPFNERELVVRARNLLRRIPDFKAQTDRLHDRVFRFEGWSFLPLKHRVECDTTRTNLTRAESVLLSTLLTRPGTVYTRQQLLDAIHGGEADSGDRTVDVLILRLRRKLNDDPRAPRLITTVPGVGYYFSCPVSCEH